MAIEKTLKNIEGVKSIRYDDKDNRFGDEIKVNEFSKIKPPFDLVLRFKKDGKRYYHRMTFKAGRTFRKALEYAKEELNRLRREDIPDKAKIPTYEKLLEEFIEQKKNSMTVKNQKHYIAMMNNHLSCKFHKHSSTHYTFYLPLIS